LNREEWQKTFVKQDGFVTREIGGETVIVPVRNHVGDLDAIYTLNEVGTRIWRLVDGEASVERIGEALCHNFEIHLEEAARDTYDFLRRLETAGLVWPADPRGGGREPN
jgi:hypothetical protein